MKPTLAEVNLRSRPQDHMRTRIADALFAEAAKARARIDKWIAMGTKAEIALAKLEAEEDAFMRAGQMTSTGIADVEDRDGDVADVLLAALEGLVATYPHSSLCAPHGCGCPAHWQAARAAIAKARGAP
jgi:hypothetical protein